MLQVRAYEAKLLPEWWNLISNTKIKRIKNFISRHITTFFFENVIYYFILILQFPWIRFVVLDVAVSIAGSLFVVKSGVSRQKRTSGSKFSVVLFFQILIVKILNRIKCKTY